MDELQRLVTELEMMVLREVTGHDADTAAMWAEELVDEAFAEQPRLPLLRIYVNEIEKKATRARALRDLIESVRQAIV
ncbi:hypothetical protein GCN78_16980 [Janthinobacterium rivuli]|uniref:hypothetical protein n=1 Tax=Janthinobacterium sp. FT68W TaxID=2654255 RepID=UPI00126582D3|nr:hypothetical protein [Janthinobacterium sp. FT68W]KAB8049585.1 hypothetical protein GCN78_16980 [Janthinobacterium sp. FT68W]